MSDLFKTYEAARKSMYAAMGQEQEDPVGAMEQYRQATATFASFLSAATKSRGMYRELVISLRPSVCALFLLNAF